LVGKYYRQSVLTQASLAQAERDLGQLEPAETLLREAIDTCDFLARGDPDVQYRELQGVLAGNLGRTLSCADRDDEGETELTKAIDRLQTLAQSDPASSHYRDELAWSYMYRGDLFRSRGQTELAAADYRQVCMLRVQLADNPLDVQNQYRLAWFLANCPDPGHRDPEEAVRWAQQAVKQIPDSATYRNALGAAYLRCGKLDEAVEHLEKAAELRSGEHCRDGLLLAIAYCKREDREKAREVFDRAADWMDKHCPGNEQWTRIRREAEECLGQRAVETEAP
jgi:tetratricopeptide (TPR) repeat protein